MCLFTLINQLFLQLSRELLKHNHKKQQTNLHPPHPPQPRLVYTLGLERCYLLPQFRPQFPPHSQNQ